MSNGYFDADGPRTLPKRAAWSVKFASGRVPMAYAITSEPVPVQDRLIVGLLDERIVALDPSTGAESWSSRASCPGAPHPAVLRGAVFASLDNSPPSILSLELESGATRWSTELEPGPPYGVLRPVAVAADRVFAVVGKSVMALAADSGIVLWRVTIGESAWPVGLAADDAAVVVTVADGSERGRLSVGLDAATGVERWRLAGEGRIAPSIAGGDVFCAGPEATLTAVDAATGAVRWRGPSNLQPWSEPAVASDVVLVTRRISIFDASEPLAEIHALDRATGTPKWTHRAPGNAFDPQVALGRRAAFFTAEKLRAIDRESGALLWEWSPPAKVRMERRPAVWNGMLFVPTDKGLFALR